MATIFHIALASDWAAAQAAGAYTTSTRGRTLAEEGFIHCSRGDQWPQVRSAVYGDLDPASEPLLLLQIDTTRLDVPVIDEAPEPGAETFPHVYGPLPLDAVVKAIPLSGASAPAPAVAAPGPAPAPAVVPDEPARPTESFGRLYFREMAFNMALILLVMAVTTVGIGVGHLVHEENGPGVGALVGLVAGIAVAARLFRRRHRAPRVA